MKRRQGMTVLIGLVLIMYAIARGPVRDRYPPYTSFAAMAVVAVTLVAIVLERRRRGRTPEGPVRYQRALTLIDILLGLSLLWSFLMLAVTHDVSRIRLPGMVAMIVFFAGLLIRQDRSP